MISCVRGLLSSRERHRLKVKNIWHDAKLFIIRYLNIPSLEDTILNFYIRQLIRKSLVCRTVMYSAGSLALANSWNPLIIEIPKIFGKNAIKAEITRIFRVGARGCKFSIDGILCLGMHCFFSLACLEIYCEIACQCQVI